MHAGTHVFTTVRALRLAEAHAGAAHLLLSALQKTAPPPPPPPATPPQA